MWGSLESPWKLGLTLPTGELVAQVGKKRQRFWGSNPPRSGLELGCKMMMCKMLKGDLQQGV